MADKELPIVQKRIRDRARYWYDLAMPEITGLVKAKVDKRIKELEDAEAAAAAKPESKADLRFKARYKPGLVAEIYADTHCLQRATSRIDSKIDFDWGHNAPDPAVASQFYSIRWRGYFKLNKGGNVTFFTNSCNGIRVFIDNNLLIDRNTANDQWKLQAATNLNSGFHTIEVQFMHGVLNSYCHVAWQLPGAKSASPIEPGALFHDAMLEESAGIAPK